MTYFKILIFLLLSFSLNSQSSISLKGKVIEIKDSKSIGVPGVVVSVSGESYDVTGEDGSFKLFAPSGLDFVTITIRGSQSTMISPFDGKISIPPSYEPIEIKLCNKANIKLFAKVQALQAKVKNLQKQNQLSARKAELLYKNMIDTISAFELKIESYRQELAAANNREKQLEEKIETLEKENGLLEEKLFNALGERYIAQQKTFESISKELNEYISRVKDLQKILPTDASACVVNSSACDKFYGYIEQYNKIRNSIDKNKDLNLSSVGKLWSSEHAHHELKDIYDFILFRLHEPLLFTKMNDLVMNKIKNVSTGKSNRNKSSKEIESNAIILANELTPLILELDQEKSKLFQILTTEIQ